MIGLYYSLALMPIEQGGEQDDAAVASAQGRPCLVTLVTDSSRLRLQNEILRESRQ